MPNESKTCFIAMPITTRDHEAEKYGDNRHWEHVMDTLFVKAIEAAGYQAIRPAAQGAHLIHEVIIKHLEQSDLVLCDLSGHNPNVFFELGVRTSLNKPIALVRDEFTEIPFDTGGINTYTYKSSLHGWDMDAENDGLRKHLKECALSCAGENPLWRKFGLLLKAQEPQTAVSPFEANVQLLAARLPELEDRLAMVLERNDSLETGFVRQIGAPLDEVAVNRIIDLFAQGATVKSIAEQMRLSESTVRKRLKEFEATGSVPGVGRA
ncbi:hypothetical protein GCM10028784_06410 [Myceligenerans cantabricum]